MKTFPRSTITFLAIAGMLLAGLLSRALATPTSPTPAGDAWDGEAVDLSTGLFAHAKVDLRVTDVMPVSLVRIAQIGRPGVFGIGASHPYELRLSTAAPYQDAALIVPDGSVIRYVRVSPGTDALGAIFEPVRAPTPLHGSAVSWSGGWMLRTADATFYAFDQQGRLERITDAAGRVGEVLRADTSQGAGLGPITRITSPSGRWIGLAYDSAGRIAQARDAGGRLVSYAYDNAGRLASVTDPEGGVTRYTYDASHRIATITDARGVLWLTNDYDVSGRVVRQTRADQGTYRFAYALDAGGNVVRADVTDPRGVIRRVTFDANGYRLTDVRAVGTSVEQAATYERDASGFVSSVTDALGRRTAFTYDARGNVTTVTHLAGSADARTTALGYMSAGSLGIPRVSTITDPMGHVTSLVYDGQGFPAEIIDPLGLRTRLTIANGSLLQIVDPVGHATALSYAAGAITAIVDPLGRVRARGYDAWARLASETDALGKRTTASYDRLDRVREITDAAGSATRFAYDGAGNVLTVTDARGHITRYAYDAMNRLVARTDPLGGSESYSYDAGGNLVSATDRRGHTTVFGYDALDRLVSARHADASITAYVWDAGNRLVEIADSVSGPITRAYDLHDALLSEATPQGTVRYAYDAAGRRIRTTVEGEPAVEHAYDAAGRLTQITRGGDVIEIGYDGAGRRTSLALPYGISAEYAYDAGSQLIALTYRRGDGILGTLAYAYDAAGHRVRAAGTWARLGPAEPVTSATYDDGNRPLSFGLLSLAHDPNGNLLSDGSSTYTWDVRNRLIAIDGPGVTADFAYDALGRRQAKRVDDRTSWFVHDGMDAVKELGAGGAVHLLGAEALDPPLARWDDDGLLALLTDGFGSVIALVDEAGALQGEYTYAAFGASAVTTGLDVNPYQFAGGENDGAGLYRHGVRYYHPKLQRFVSEHPLGFAAGDTNLYAYAGNNPIAVTHRVPAAMIVRPESTAAGAVAVDAAVVGRLVGIPASPEQQRALSDAVVMASVERAGGLPLPSPRTPERLLSGPPAAIDGPVSREPWRRPPASVPVRRPPFAIRTR